MYKYFTCKIHDTLREGDPTYLPIMLSTKIGVQIDGINALPYLSMPDTRSRAIQPSQVNASATNLEINIYNNGTEISELLYERMNTTEDTGAGILGTMFWNEKVEIWGHINDIESDRIYFGHIEGITNDPLETIYTLSTIDVFQLIKTDIFTRELSKYTDDGITETISNVNSWRMPTGFTVGEEDDIDDPTIKIRYLEFNGNAIDCLEGLLQFIFSLPQNQIGTSFLTNDYLSYIDEASFDQVKIDIGIIANEYYFKWYNGISDPFDFIKEQIFKPCTVFPFITEDGRLGIKIHQQPSGSEIIETFDESKIIGIIDKQNTMEEYVNHIVVDYQRTITKDKDHFVKTTYAIEADALKKTKFLSPRGNPLKFELEGINFGGDAGKQEAVVVNTIRTFFERYSTSITKISFLTTMDLANGIQVGDYIGLEHKNLIEWFGETAGQRGLIGVEVEPTNPIAYLNEGDNWAGFVNNNGLGTSIDAGNYVFLDTETPEMIAELFRDLSSPGQSCQSNHAEFQTWLSYQT